MGKAISCILAVTLLYSGGFGDCAAARSQNDLEASMRAAEHVLAKFQNDPTKEELRDKLKQAKAILIISPGMDRGVALARKERGEGWSSPAFYRITNVVAGGVGAGGAGVSVGRQNLEMIVLAMSDKALAWIIAPQLPGTGKMKIESATGTSGGGEQNPVDVVLFERTEASAKQGRARKSDFASTYVSVDKAGNQAYYGRPATPNDILVTQKVTSPAAASLQAAVAAAAK